jgi:hypothetical protein
MDVANVYLGEAWVDEAWAANFFSNGAACHLSIDGKGQRVRGQDNNTHSLDNAYFFSKLR